MYSRGSHAIRLQWLLRWATTLLRQKSVMWRRCDLLQRHVCPSCISDTGYRVYCMSVSLWPRLRKQFIVMTGSIFSATMHRLSDYNLRALCLCASTSHNGTFLSSFSKLCSLHVYSSLCLCIRSVRRIQKTAALSKCFSDGVYNWALWSQRVSAHNSWTK